MGSTRAHAAHTATIRPANKTPLVTPRQRPEPAKIAFRPNAQRENRSRIALRFVRTNRLMRIVFASLGSLGDLHPLLALAAATRDRGHDPLIAASEIYRDDIGKVGFAFHPIRPDFEFESGLVARLFDPVRGPQRLMREQVFPSVRETYADLVAATDNADLLVVGELLYVAPLVAAKRKIPWINAVLAPTSFLSAYDPCVLAPAPALHPLRHLGTWPHRLIFALGRRVTSRWSAPLTAFRRELGFPPAGSPIFDAKHSPSLTLALFPEFLAAPQRDWPTSTRQTGFVYFTQSAQPDVVRRIEKFKAAGDPPIVFTLGSSVVHIAREFYDWAARVASDLGRRAILLTGKNAVPADLPPSLLAIDYAPLEHVLPGAAAVVHQGGVGTCAEALRWGVPSLVIPFGFDQPDNAKRLHHLGVAHVLPRRKLSAARLAAHLRTLLADDRVQAKARSLSTQIDPTAALDDSIKALETLAAVPTPPTASTPPATPSLR